MPCGGIEPMSNPDGLTIKDKLPPTKGGCWMCSRGGCKHFCHEWDTYIHARCVPAFLKTEEGKIIMGHKHLVVLEFELEEEFDADEMSAMRP
jgi:hypothetical protein